MNFPETILSHGTVDNFNEEMLKRKKLRKRRRHLVRRKISEGAKNGLSVESSSESADDDDTSKVQQSKEVGKEVGINFINYSRQYFCLM